MYIITFALPVTFSAKIKMMHFLRGHGLTLVKLDGKSAKGLIVIAKNKITIATTC
jgi:hypothetical protein